MSSPFLTSVRHDLRLWGYSIRTEKGYLILDTLRLH